MAEQRPAEHEYESGIDMARAELAEFASNKGLDGLTKLYGVQLPPNEPGYQRERLVAAQEVAANYWDFRKGAERQNTDWNIEGELSSKGSKAWKAVFADARELGLVRSSILQNRQPKYLSILGGANESAVNRLRFGLESTDDFEYLVFLGASRPLPEKERERVKNFAPNAKTEYDLGSAAFETMLDAKLTDDFTDVRNGDVWGTRVYNIQHKGRKKTAFVLSTPREIHDADDPEKPRRATTYDNFRFFARQVELADGPTATVAAITTAHYTRAQHLPAVQELTLPYGVRVETIGHRAKYAKMQRTPGQLLQEVKAAIDAGVRLQDVIDDADQSRLRAMRLDAAQRIADIEELWRVR